MLPATKRCERCLKDRPVNKFIFNNKDGKFARKCGDCLSKIGKELFGTGINEQPKPCSACGNHYYYLNWHRCDTRTT